MTAKAQTSSTPSTGSTASAGPDLSSMTLDQLKAYATQQGAAGPDAIGVANDYVAHRQTQFALGPTPKPGQGGMPASGVYDQQIPAQYHEGDQDILFNMDPVVLSQLQASLRNAGLLTAGYVQGYGGDPQTLAAYTQLLTEANETGFTWQQQLQQRLASPQTQAAKAPFVAKAYLKPDPATLKESVRQLMKQVVGPDREPTDAELADMTARLDSLDRRAYDSSTTADRANYDATNAATNADGTPATGALGGGIPATGALGGATVQDVDPTSQLADYMRTAYKPEIQHGQAVVDLSKNRTSLLGSVFAMDSAIKAGGI